MLLELVQVVVGGVGEGQNGIVLNAGVNDSKSY